MKAEAARLRDGDGPPIIAADTVVALDGRLLGKPRDAAEAREMLTILRGREHHVVTAVAVMPEGKRSSLVRNPITRVTMRAYSDAEIESSIARGDPFDKAGGYAIQDEALPPRRVLRRLLLQRRRSPALEHGRTTSTGGCPGHSRPR